MVTFILAAMLTLSEPPVVQGFKPSLPAVSRFEPPTVEGFRPKIDPPTVEGFSPAKSIEKPVIEKPGMIRLVSPGYHIHKCPSCSTEWSHSDHSSGDVAKHTCPSCNKLLPGDWPVYMKGVRLVESSAISPTSPAQYPQAIGSPTYNMPSRYNWSLPNR